MKRILTILFIMVSVIYADEFVVQSFEYDQNDISGRVHSKKDVNGDYCAIIKVRTGLKNLNFHSNQLSDLVPKTGEYWLYVSPGIRYLEIMKDGFPKMGYRIPKKIQTQAVYVMKLSYKTDLNQFGKGKINVNIQPKEANASFTIDGIPRISGKSGFSDSLAAGKWLFKFQPKSKYYKPKSKVFIIKPNVTNNIKIELEDISGHLKVIPQTTSAKVYLNGNYDELLSNHKSKRLVQGNYKLSIRKEKYFNINRDIQIKKGQIKTVKETLKPKLGKVKIISLPFDKTIGSTIYIDSDRVYDKTTPALLSFMVGEYDITVRHPKFLEQTKKIKIQEGVQKKLIFNLQSYEGSLLQKERYWNKKKWLSFGSTALMLCAGVACNYLGDQSYDDYQNAADNSAASQSWNDTNLYYNVRDITYTVSLAPLIYGVYSWARQVHFKNRRVER